MKPFSLQIGDKFVHRKTSGIYKFDGLSINTKTNNAEVAYHNQEKESFTRDMGEFFGYNEDKTKRFLPLKEYLDENEDRNVVVAEYKNNKEEVLLSIVCDLELNGKKYICYYYEKDMRDNEDTVEMIVGIVESENEDYTCIAPIEDDEEFQAVCDEFEKVMNELED